MTLPIIDSDGRATIAAAEGQAALATGDTPLAKQKFAEAGKILVTQVPTTRKVSDKHFLRFLAATQYFKGGFYDRALNQCQKIQKSLLPDSVRSLFDAFDRDVRARASKHYEKNFRQTLIGLSAKKDAVRVLELLQDHPYVLDAGQLAFIRAVACEDLKKYHAATLFYADAVRRHRNDPRLAYLAAALPLNLPQAGRFDEAWEYTQYQIQIMPNPLAYVNASLLSFHRASEAADAERESWTRQQIEYFGKAWDSYQALPAKEKNYELLVSLVALGLESIPFGYMRLNDPNAALEKCNLAVEFRANNPNPYVVRGIVTYPSIEAVKDFETAIRLNDRSYFPYYYLADYKIKTSEYTEAIGYCKQALMYAPRPEIESQLYGWMGVCMFEQGKPRTETEWLFQKARELNPKSEVATFNYDRLLESFESHVQPLARRWRVEPTSPWQEENFVIDRQKQIRWEDLDPRKSLQKVLQPS